MKKALLYSAALILGLFFFCTKVYACESEEVLPKAGFQEFIEDIECKPTVIHPRYILTDEDADLLLRIGVLEGGGTDQAAIANVMQVVLNRTFDCDDFPHTIREVIFQPGQFTTADRLARANITPEAWAALDCVIFGDYQFNECLYFESLEGHAFESWAEYTFSYGGHDFYKGKES